MCPDFFLTIQALLHTGTLRAACFDFPGSDKGTARSTDHAAEASYSAKRKLGFEEGVTVIFKDEVGTSFVHQNLESSFSAASKPILQVNTSY